MARLGSQETRVESLGIRSEGLPGKNSSAQLQRLAMISLECHVGEYQLGTLGCSLEYKMLLTQVGSITH